jgi:hypothetical protein
MASIPAVMAHPKPISHSLLASTRISIYCGNNESSNMKKVRDLVFTVIQPSDKPE